MIAALPRDGSLRSWAHGGAAHAGGLLVGAAITAVVIGSVGSLIDVKPEVVGLYIFGVGIVAVVLGHRRRLGSDWRVPGTWSRFGGVRYSGLFGVALGVGGLTALPSIGAFAVIAWGMSDPDYPCRRPERFEDLALPTR